MYLLDTDVISNFRNRPHPKLVEWIKTTDPDDIAVSAITVFEIQAGINYARKSAPTKADEIDRWLHGFMLAGGMSILPMDTQVARLYADMFTTPGLKNFLYPDPNSKRPKSGADLIIAATAITHHATIVSFNQGDFELIHSYFSLPGMYNPAKAHGS